MLLPILICGGGNHRADIKQQLHIYQNKITLHT